jgi:hypothetical protein
MPLVPPQLLSWPCHHGHPCVVVGKHRQTHRSEWSCSGSISRRRWCPRSRCSAPWPSCPLCAPGCGRSAGPAPQHVVSWSGSGLGAATRALSSRRARRHPVPPARRPGSCCRSADRRRPPRRHALGPGPPPPARRGDRRADSPRMAPLVRREPRRDRSGPRPPPPRPAPAHAGCATDRDVVDAAPPLPRPRLGSLDLDAGDVPRPRPTVIR